MPETDSQSTPPKGLAAGCLTVLGILAVLLAALWFGVRDSEEFQTLRKIAGAAAGEARAMAAVKRYLVEIYPAEKVEVGVNVSSTGETSQRILAVKFVNPTFAVDSSSPGATVEPREIALAVAAEYSNVDRFDAIRVEIVRGVGAGITAEGDASFNFSTDGLQADLPN